MIAANEVPLEVLMRSIDPESECGTIAVVSAFADESGTHDGSPIVAVAMYLAPVTPVDYWARFRSDWTSRVLQGDDAAIFHMKSAVRHLGKSPEWDERLMAAAEIILKHTKLRIATTINAADYKKFVTDWRKRMPRGFPPETIYSFGITECLREVIWNAPEAGLDDWITYIFEAGHKNWGQVRNYLDSMMVQPDMRKKLRLYAYLTQRKQDRKELQAADLFAFWLRQYSETVDLRKEQYAASSIALMLGGGTHTYTYWDAEKLNQYLEINQVEGLRMRREMWQRRLRRIRARRLERPSEEP